MQHWAGIAIEGHVPWPPEDTTTKFCGHEVTLRAETKSSSPAIEIEYDSTLDFEEIVKLLRRFLSSLVWVEGFPLREISCLGGGCRVRFGKNLHGRFVTERFRADYMPEPEEPKAKLALALYREALGLNSVPYQFLGFFKIINILYSGSKEQKNWIADTLPLIQDSRTTERVKELGEIENDIPEYLYKSGRCAVAHAFSDPVVDPDDFRDQKRLQSDLPIMRALAEYVIESELGVKSRRTVWKEHLYELQGFREIFGTDLVEGLKNGEILTPDEIPVFPEISVRLRDHDDFLSLENLAPHSVIPLPGGVILELISHAVPLRLALILNFKDESLIFDPSRNLRLKDDGSSEVIKAAIDRLRFIMGLVSNGELEVYQTSPKRLLGRCDPNIPVNIDLPGTLDDLEGEVEKLQIVLDSRETG